MVARLFVAYHYEVFYFLEIQNPKMIGRIQL